MSTNNTDERTMRRRSFMRHLLGASGLVVGSGAWNLANGFECDSRCEIGEVRSVKVTCVSETGWFDTSILWDDVQRAGGLQTNQYDIPYAEDNLGGFCALIDVEALDGEHTLYLLDSGWSVAWMDHAFEKAGVDALLRSGAIKTLIVSHDHNDHFFGIESTLKRAPDITIYHPETIQKKSLQVLDGVDFSAPPGCPKNRIPHLGTRIPTRFGELYVPQPGMAVTPFDVKMPLGVRGENVMYLNVKDKGFVVITGCGHPGLSRILAYPVTHFKDGEKLYGCYGGLHIAPLEKWESRMQESITLLQQAGLQKIACNHCTGRVWGEHAAKQGLSVVRGTENYRSYTKVAALGKDADATLYIGNGDSVRF